MSTMGTPPEAATRPRRRRAGVAMALAAVLALPALPARAADEPFGPASEHIASTLLRLVQEGDREPVVGVPPVRDVGEGRVRVITDPAYWSSYVHEALVEGVVILPQPIDLVQPQAYLPTVRVAPGDRRSTLPERPVDLLDVTYEHDGRVKTVEEFITTTETDGLVFAHGGEVVAEHYANGWSPDVRHQMWSVTKSVVSALVGIAVDEGRVGSVDDPIEAYIGELAGTAWEGATVRNLLHMESGVHWDGDTPVLVENTQVQQWVQMALDLYTDGALGQTRNEFLASLPRVAEPGTAFSYNSGNTQVLAWILETVYERPFHEVLSDELWTPAGMADDAEILTDRVGDAVASQSLYARSHDWLRFGEVLRNGGRAADGTQVVPEAWVEEATTMTATSDGRYGYQLWAGPTPDGYGASGFQGNKITVAPGVCLTGVRMSHQLGADLRSGDDPADPNAYGFEVEMGAAEWEAVYRAVADELGACPPFGVIPALPQAELPPPEAAGPVDAAAPDAGAPGVLPATGGGGGLGLVLLGLAVALRRHADPAAVRRRTRAPCAPRRTNGPRRRCRPRTRAR